VGEGHLSDEAVEQAKKEILFGAGYKNPPQHRRFKKGQSGNPKGRPKSYDIGLGNSRSINALALKEGERPITVREGTEAREMPLIEATIRKQFATALQGNAYAQKHVTERHGRAEKEQRAQRLQNIEVWKTYISQCQDAINQAKERKEIPPSPLPHPDDIVIDYEQGVQFKGPINEAELVQLQEHIKIRDVLIM
jgi:hypothetical protein